MPNFLDQFDASPQRIRAFADDTAAEENLRDMTPDDLKRIIYGTTIAIIKVMVRHHTGAA